MNKIMYTKHQLKNKKRLKKPIPIIHKNLPNKIRNKSSNPKKKLLIIIKNMRLKNLINPIKSNKKQPNNLNTAQYKTI